MQLHCKVRIKKRRNSKCIVKKQLIESAITKIIKRLLTENKKTKLVVIDDEVLGYIDPATPNRANVLRSSSKSVHKDGDVIYLQGRDVRLASARDFDQYRVSFNGFKNDPEYEYAK